MGRWIILDAQQAGVPHLAVVWLLPLTLMAGPCGLAAYVVAVKPLSRWVRWAAVRSAILSLLFAAVWFLSLMMAGWVLVFPASFRSGDWLGPHDAELKRVFDAAAAQGSPMPTPLSLLTKYSEHRMVQLTHILPSALWSLAIPLQLNPSIRTNYKSFHRATGMVFFLCAVRFILKMINCILKMMDCVLTTMNFIL